MFIAILTGAVSGIISGMGIGGGTILIPALTMFLHVNQHIAQGVNLLYFIPTAVVALIIHRKNGAVTWKLAIPVMLFGLIGASLGALVALKIKASLLRRLFGGFLFLMGGYEIYKGFQKKESK